MRVKKVALASIWSVLLILCVVQSEVTATDIERWPSVSKSIEWASKRYFVSEAVLRAIRNVESRNNPYALNLQSKTRLERYFDSDTKYQMSVRNSKYMYSVFPSTYDEAIKILREVIPRCTAYDIGWFQISSGKIQDFGIAPEDLLIPQYNAAWGAKILHDCTEKEKDLWYSIECYHRGSSKQQITSYSHAVYQASLHLQR